MRDIVAHLIGQPYSDQIKGNHVFIFFKAKHLT